jgi:hypothetical protein
MRSRGWIVMLGAAALLGCANRGGGDATSTGRTTEHAAADAAAPPAAATPAPDAAVPTGKPTPDGWAHFGAGVTPSEVVPIATVLADPQAHAGRTLTIEGTVAEVCLVKGCWLTMRDGDREMRVTFKDYGFFVPKESGGKRVRVQGVFAIEDVPVETARHYLEDAGKHDEAARITAPVPSFTFVATGVQMQF